MLQKFLRLTGLDDDLHQMSVSVETRALGMFDQARAMAVRSAIVIAITSVALMALTSAIAIALVALYLYVAARYDPTTALAAVAGGLIVLVLIMGIVAISIAKAPAGGAIGRKTLEEPGANQGSDRAERDVAKAARSAADATKVAAATDLASATTNPPDTPSSADNPTTGSASSNAEATPNVGSTISDEKPSLSAAADAIFRTFGTQVNNEKEFMSSTMSVLGHFVRTPKTGVGPIDDMIDKMSPRLHGVGEEAANQAAEYVRASDRTTFWSILGVAAAIGFVVARNNVPPKT